MRWALAAWALALTIEVAPPARADARLVEALAGVKAATEEGAVEVVGLLHAGVVQPPGRVDPHASALCMRYLVTAEARLGSLAPARLAERLDALEALAHCAFLNGDDAAARRASQALVAAGDEGAERALRFAERTLWPAAVAEALRAPVPPQDLEVPGSQEGAAIARRHAEVTRRLSALERDRAWLVEALAGSRPRGGLLVTAVGEGGAAARAGLRPGDVLLSLDARPVRSAAQVAVTVSDGAPWPVLILRAGQRIEGRWVGAEPRFEAVPVPERLAP